MRFTFTDLFHVCVPPFVVFLAADSLKTFYEPYSTVWWWNVLFHFLGGISMAASGFFLLRFFKRIGCVSTADAVVDGILVVLFTMSIAVCWEFYEFLSDTFLYTHSQVSNFDTMKDLCMGTLGALVCAAFSLIWNRTQPNK